MNSQEDILGMVATEAAEAAAGSAPSTGSGTQTDKQRVEAAWHRVLVLGQKLEPVSREKRDLLEAIRLAVDEAVRIEKDTGEKW